MELFQTPGGWRGRMIIPEDRQMAIELIDEAVTAGARQHSACKVIEIDARTLRRWQKQQQEEQELRDRRKESAAAREPANKLTEHERARILEVCNAVYILLTGKLTHLPGSPYHLNSGRKTPDPPSRGFSGVDVSRCVERREGDIAECYADPASAKEVLGWEAELGLEEMCRDSWRFIK